MCIFIISDPDFMHPQRRACPFLTISRNYTLSACSNVFEFHSLMRNSTEKLKSYRFPTVWQHSLQLNFRLLRPFLKFSKIQIVFINFTPMGALTSECLFFNFLNQFKKKETFFKEIAKFLRNLQILKQLLQSSNFE